MFACLAPAAVALQWPALPSAPHAKPLRPHPAWASAAHDKQCGLPAAAAVAAATELYTFVSAVPRAAWGRADVGTAEAPMCSFFRTVTLARQSSRQSETNSLNYTRRSHEALHSLPKG